jgi:O-antigen ligase
LSQFTDPIITLELVWPFPLIAVGVLRILDPLLVGIAALLALLPWVARWFIFGKLTRRAFIGSALVLLVISAFISVWVSYDPSLSWPLLLTLLGSVSLFFAIVNTKISPRQVGSGLVVAASLAAFYFVGQYGHFYYPNEVGRLANLGRLTGSLLPNLVLVTPHPNAVAGFLESVWLLSLVLAWRARSGERVAWGLAVAIITYALFISASRGAWIGLAVAVGIWALLLVPRRSIRLAIGGLGLAVASLGLYMLFQVASARSQIPVLSSALNAAHSRLILYRNSLYLWSDYLFTGTGLGDTFAWIYSRYQLLIQYQFLTYSHNLFLSVGLGLGMLGLVALIWLLVSFYRFVIRIETKGGLSPRSLPLFRAAWLGATATFVHGLTDAPQFAGSGWTMPMLFAILGLAVAIGRPEPVENEDVEVEEAPFATSRRGWGMRGGVVVVLVIIALIFWRPLLSVWYANLGAIYQTRAELAPGLDDAAREAAAKLAVDDFARALSLNPTQAVANRRLGLMALDRENFDTAVAYLQQAHRREPGNQATLKALGLAYLWVGRLDDAETLLRQIDDQEELIEELDNLGNWRESQGQLELSKYAREMAQRLSTTS